MVTALLILVDSGSHFFLFLLTLLSSVFLSNIQKQGQDFIP